MSNIPLPDCKCGRQSTGLHANWCPRAGRIDDLSEKPKEQKLVNPTTVFIPIRRSFTDPLFYGGLSPYERLRRVGSLVERSDQ